MGKKVALVLSGGGARGMAHIGVIEELEKRGYEISSVAGTSMGALVGGVYASGKLKEFKEWATSLERSEMFRLIDFSFGGGGIIKGDKVLNAMQKVVPEVNIEDLQIPYSATAVNIVKHEEVVYRSGSLYEAIRASIAIPSVFTPLRKGDAVIVDGGVMNNLPLSNVSRTSDDTLIAVYVNANVPVPQHLVHKEDEHKGESRYKKWLNDFHLHLHLNHPKEKKEKFTFLNLIDQTFATGMLHLVNHAIEKEKPDVLINVSRNACGTYDFFMGKELIEIGRHAAQTSLDTIEKNDENFNRK